MKPVSPVVPKTPLPEVVYGEDQGAYVPAIRTTDGGVLTRWRCTWKDRLRIFITGNVYHYQETFNEPMQPVKLKSEFPEITLNFNFSRRWKDRLKWAFNFNRKLGWVKLPYRWLCWDFYEDSDARIYISKGSVPHDTKNVRVIWR